MHLVINLWTTFYYCQDIDCGLWLQGEWDQRADLTSCFNETCCGVCVCVCSHIPLAAAALLLCFPCLLHYWGGVRFCWLFPMWFLLAEAWREPDPCLLWGPGGSSSQTLNPTMCWQTHPYSMDKSKGKAAYWERRCVTPPRAVFRLKARLRRGSFKLR